MTLVTPMHPGPVQVDACTASALKQLAEDLRSVAGGRIDSREWIRAARQAWAGAPEQLRSTLAEFRRDSGTPGTLLIRGLPVADEHGIPDTPAVGGSVQRTASVPAAVLMLAAHGLGDPIAFRQEKSGALVQDVVPVPGQEDFQGNAGSTRLTFHVENAFHDHRPDYVMLLCLRADHGGSAELRTCSTREVLSRLSEASLRTLRGPHFVTAPPPSFGPGAGGRPHAVLTGSPEDPVLRVDEAATKPLTRQAAAAMAELGELFQNSYNAVRLLPGDLAVVDNRVTVHGRSAFRPRYDGRDRWLQRTFVAADLHRSRALRPGDGHVLAS